MHRSVDIHDISWREFADKSSSLTTVLLPVGSVEAYGPHLPLGTDGLVALAVARLLAERLGGLVGPLIPVGWTAVLADFPGTLSVPTDALKAYCDGVARSAMRSGVPSVVFVNGHAGNIAVLDDLCYELAADYTGRVVLCVNTWQFIQPLSERFLASSANKFGHAGELNTSVMLYLYPELVRMDRAAVHPSEGTFDPPGVARPYSFRSIAPEASLGDPTLATAEKGKQILALALDRLGDYLSAAGVGRSGPGVG